MRLWVAFPMSAELSSQLKDVFVSAAYSDDFKSLLISSLLLGLLEHYDERRLMLLLDVYASSPLGTPCHAGSVRSSHGHVYMSEIS